MSNFHSVLHTTRIARGLTLAAAARLLGIDLIKLSKMERGIDPAPACMVQVVALATKLGLKEDQLSDFLAAAVASQQLPPVPLPTDADIDEMLPMPFALFEGCAQDDRLRAVVRDGLTPTAALSAR